LAYFRSLLIELSAASDLARLWEGQGRHAEARELLTPVYSWFTEGFDTADLKEAKALHGEIIEPAIAAVHPSSGLKQRGRAPASGQKTAGGGGGGASTAGWACSDFAEDSREGRRRCPRHDGQTAFPRA
jgi:hypothetical protein